MTRLIERPTTFSGGDIERCGEMRGDAAALERAFRDPAARFVPIWGQRCLVEGTGAGLVERTALRARPAAIDEAIFLGRRGAHFVFALGVAETAGPPVPDGRFAELRELMAELPADDAALLAYARGMVWWRERHRFCGACGQPNRPRDGGFVMACPDPACGHRSFPRIDPAIIVLVRDGDRVLLGRQPRWPEGRFSTLAGFVEPGESLEDAVRREVHEEAGVRVAACHYLASQPWPFPAALMIGFHARAASTAIELLDGELAEARWVTRDDIRARRVVLPPATSVAFRLIEAWFDEARGPGLAELGLAGPPLRLRRPLAGA